MSNEKTLLIALLATAFSVLLQAASPSPLMKLPMIDSVKIGDFDIVETGVSRHFTLPEMQPKVGYIPVLRCRMGTYKDGFGGCCFAAKINISGTDIGAQTAAGEVRMLGKHPRFEMTGTFRGRHEQFATNGSDSCFVVVRNQGLGSLNGANSGIMFRHGKTANSVFGDGHVESNSPDFYNALGWHPDDFKYVD